MRQTAVNACSTTRAFGSMIDVDANLCPRIGRGPFIEDRSMVPRGHSCAARYGSIPAVAPNQKTDWLAGFEESFVTDR